MTLVRSATTASGATIQPMRQPVIDQDFEKLLTEMTRSPSSARASNDGADLSAGLCTSRS